MNERSGHSNGASPKGRDGTDQVTAPDTRKGINSVEIGLRVLDALVRADGPMALKDVSLASDLSASQTHRYLTSLMRQNMVTQDPATGRYDLGEMALRVGLAALNRLDPIAAAEEGLAQLVDHVDETSMLAIWGERGPIAVRWRRGRTLIFSTVGLGTTFPLLSSTTGQLFLAYMPETITRPFLDSELEQLATDRPDRTKPDVAAIVAKIHEQGHVVLDGHLAPGVWAASAPVLDSQGELIACFTIIGASDDPPGHRKKAIARLVDAADRTSSRLGHSR